MKYYSIGEFADKIGKTIQTLRNWDKNNTFKPFGWWLDIRWPLIYFIYYVHSKYNKMKTLGLYNVNINIKVLNKKEMAENLAYVMEEVTILNTLDHPNIVKYYETYDDNKYVYLVMEYISG